MWTHATNLSVPVISEALYVSLLEEPAGGTCTEVRKTSTMTRHAIDECKSGPPRRAAAWRPCAAACGPPPRPAPGCASPGPARAGGSATSGAPPRPLLPATQLHAHTHARTHATHAQKGLQSLQVSRKFSPNRENRVARRTEVCNWSVPGLRRTITCELAKTSTLLINHAA